MGRAPHTVTLVTDARGSEGAGPCLPVVSGPGVLWWGLRRGPGWDSQEARPSSVCQAAQGVGWRPGDPEPGLPGATAVGLCDLPESAER